MIRHWCTEIEFLASLLLKTSVFRDTSVFPRPWMKVSCHPSTLPSLKSWRGVASWACLLQPLPSQSSCSWSSTHSRAPLPESFTFEQDACPPPVRSLLSCTHQMLPVPRTQVQLHLLCAAFPRWRWLLRYQSMKTAQGALLCLLCLPPLQVGKQLSRLASRARLRVYVTQSWTQSGVAQSWTRLKRLSSNWLPTRKFAALLFLTTPGLHKTNAASQPICFW